MDFQIQASVCNHNPFVIAIFTALSRKGYWRLAHTLATHTGMTNKWLQEQGLIQSKNGGCVSITRLWPDALHEPPCANPHAKWGEEKNLPLPDYAIMSSIAFNHIPLEFRPAPIRL